jgi:uncharacterized membrane protein YbhN (UPF0104 family)
VSDVRASDPINSRRLAWRAARLLGIGVVVVLVIATVPGLAALRSRFERAAPGWIVAAGMLEVGSVLSFAVAFHRTFARRLPSRTSVSLALTAQGVNVLVPAGGTGGLAVAGAVMARAGVPARVAVSRMVALFLISGVAPNVALIVLAGLGVGSGLLPGHASVAASWLPAAIAAALTGTAWRLSGRLHSRDGEIRTGWRRWLSHVSDGVNWARELLRRRDPLLLAGAFGFVLLDLAAIGAAFQAIGSPGLPLGTLALAYALGQAGSVIPLPGTTEGGLIGVFLLYGAALVPATSAILLYRAVQTLVPLSLGLIGLVELRHLAPALGNLEETIT